MEIPKEVKSIINELKRRDFEAYIFKVFSHLLQVTRSQLKGFK